MISKGVTPTFTFTSPTGLDLTQAEKVWVTFSTPDEREIITKTDDDVTVEYTQNKSRVQVFLEQAETLKMPTGKVKVQINWTYSNHARGASNKMDIMAETNLKDEVL